MSGAVVPTLYGQALECLLHHLTAADASGAVLTGGVGVGKNRMAQEAIRRLHPETEVHRIQASPSLQDTDLGAIALLLGSPPGTLTIAQAISRLRAELGVSAGIGIHARRHERLPLLVVDRAEYLDSATGFVLAQLAQSRSIRLLLIGSATGRTGFRLEPVLASGQLAVISLDGVREDGIADMCSTILGGPASTGTIKALQQLSGGLPAIAEACVRAARDWGLLSLCGDTWVLGSEDLAGHREVESAVLGLQGQWPGRDGDGLLVLALAGPQRGPLLLAATGADPELLRGTGLVQTGIDGKLALRSPIHAEVLRRSVPPGRSTALFQRWAAACQEPWDFRQTWWAINCAVKVKPDHVRAAVHEANEQGEFAAALQLWEVAATYDDHDTALERIRALEGLGRFSGALAAIAAHQNTGGADHPLCEPAIIRHLSILLGSGANAEDLRQAARAWEGLQTGGPENAAIEACIDSARLVADFGEGGVPPDARTRIHSIVVSGPPEVALGALGVAARHLVMEGPELLVLVAPLRDALTTAAPTTARRLLAHLAVILTLGGHRAELGETVDLLSNVPGALRFGHHELAAFFDGWQQIREGAVEDGRKRLRAAIPGLHVRGFADFAALARCVGDEGPNAQDAPSAEILPRRGSWTSSETTATLPGKLVELFETTRNSGPPQRQELERLIAAYQEGGQELLEIEALLEGLSRDIIGSPEGTACAAVERLLFLVSSRSGEWATAVARITRSWLSEDPTVWLATATAVETSAYPGLALVAWARVVVGSESGQDVTQRGLALRRLHALQDAMGNAVLPVVRRALDAGDLTEREEEILKHAAVGLSNREIARELTLSQRTVEGHLYRIFAKLGVSDRTELVHFA